MGQSFAHLKTKEVFCMKLCVLTVPLYGMSLDAACKYLADSGVQALEIGCGGSPGKGHCDPDVLLKDDAKLREFADTIKKHGLELPRQRRTSESRNRRARPSGLCERLPARRKTRRKDDRHLLRLPRRLPGG